MSDMGVVCLGRVKARNADEGNFIRQYGYSLLAQHYGVPLEKVAADPKRYWNDFANTATSPVQSGHDYENVQDPLSQSPALRQMLLQNGDLFVNVSNEKRANEPFLIDSGLADNQQTSYNGKFPLFADNVIQGKRRSAVIIFDNGSRPPDNGEPGTSYGGVAYVVYTDDLGNLVAHGPYRLSTYANSISPSINKPATDEIKAYGISAGGDDYHIGDPHHSKNNAVSRALRLGIYKADSQGNETFVPEVDATGPNPKQDGRCIIKDGMIHGGKSDLGGFKSRGSEACFTGHPDDMPLLLSDNNFEWNGKNSVWGNGDGRVYTYRGDTPESLSLRNFIEGLHPTR